MLNKEIDVGKSTAINGLLYIRERRRLEERCMNIWSRLMTVANTDGGVLNFLHSLSCHRGPILYSYNSAVWQRLRRRQVACAGWDSLHLLLKKKIKQQKWWLKHWSFPLVTAPLPGERPEMESHFVEQKTSHFCRNSHCQTESAKNSALFLFFILVNIKYVLAMFCSWTTWCILYTNMSMDCRNNKPQCDKI